MLCLHSAFAARSLALPTTILCKMAVRDILTCASSRGYPGIAFGADSILPADLGSNPHAHLNGLMQCVALEGLGVVSFRTVQ